MTRNLQIEKPLALYVHIPFCAKLCHYCDFAKTANFNDDHVGQYLRTIREHLALWKDALPLGQKFTTVFFGGGTPGLLAKEYESLMAEIMTVTAPDAEVTIEANPLNVTVEKTQIWRDLGFNRISLGVQTFDDLGLKVLTRDHSVSQAMQSLEIAAKGFSKSNGDLIYGWNGQTEASWSEDLSRLASSGINHISAYALTYEGQTPLARSQRRGLLRPMAGDDLAHRYEVARESLSHLGFNHEEISNWSRPGGECLHNWVYWCGQHYVGIGAGAHGFIDDGSEIGLRYSYEGDLRRFLRSGNVVPPSSLTNASVIEITGGIVDLNRDREAWLYEYVGCALRCREGVDLSLLRDRDYELNPNEVVRRGIAEGLLFRDDQKLKASEREWFRETAWSYEICQSLFPAGRRITQNT